MCVCMYVRNTLRPFMYVYHTIAASFSGYVSLFVGSFTAVCVCVCVCVCVVFYIESTHTDRTVHFVTLLATQLNILAPAF